MKVRNTQAMAVLLEAIGLRKYEWTPTNGHIELNIDEKQLVYAINSASESIQIIYGETEEWKELCQYLIS